MSKYTADLVHFDEFLKEMKQLVRVMDGIHTEMREVRRSLINIECSLGDPQQGTGINARLSDISGEISSLSSQLSDIADSVDLIGIPSDSEKAE